MEVNTQLGALGVPDHIAVQQQLANYLRGGRRHPVLILAGPADEGKKRIVKNLAKGLLCRVKVPFCDQCSSCRRIESDLHPDVFAVREEDHEPLKVDTIRKLCHQMEISPLEGEAKVCRIEDCHRLTPASANAFLKTLEEPGPNRYFLLLTAQAGALMPTILSRCLQFHFVAETEVPLDPQKYEALLSETVRTQSATRLMASLEDKESGALFLRYLQAKLREKILAAAAQGSDAAAILPTIDIFEEAVKIEGRLRSNASYALLIENFLRQHWMQSHRSV